MTVEGDALNPPICYNCPGSQPMEPFPLLTRSETLPKWRCLKCNSIFNSRGEYAGTGWSAKPDAFDRIVDRAVAERGARAVAESIGIDFDKLRPIPQISGDTSGSLPRLRRVHDTAG